MIKKIKEMEKHLREEEAEAKKRLADEEINARKRIESEKKAVEEKLAKQIKDFNLRVQTEMANIEKMKQHIQQKMRELQMTQPPLPQPQQWHTSPMTLPQPQQWNTPPMSIPYPQGGYSYSPYG
jgi:hypothetical protein